MSQAARRTLKLEQTVGLLGELSRAQASVQDVRAALSRVRLDTVALEPFLNFAPGRYTRNLLYRDAHLELLALCWDRGVRSPIHDHAGQDCWFFIHAGTFQVEDYEIRAGGHEPGFARVERVATESGMRPGRVDARGAENPVHRVGVSERGPGVTLHLYSKPYDSCLVFSETQSRCSRRMLKYDSVGGSVDVARCVARPLLARSTVVRTVGLHHLKAAEACERELPHAR